MIETSVFFFLHFKYCRHGLPGCPVVPSIFWPAIDLQRVFKEHSEPMAWGAHHDSKLVLGGALAPQEGAINGLVVVYSIFLSVAHVFSSRHFVIDFL